MIERRDIVKSRCVAPDAAHAGTLGFKVERIVLSVVAMGGPRQCPTSLRRPYMRT